MQVILSTNGGFCHVEDVNLVCPECDHSKFKLDEGESWVGHNKREFFMIATCDKCGKKLDISVDVG
jgi:C4-type Zn-finger protein